MYILYILEVNMTMIYDKKARKKATSLTINSDLLQKAKDLKINISNCLEQSLEQLIKKKQESLWEKENKIAIELYNEDVEKNGVFSDGIRGF
jgi:antitoxin CcdA